jgi:hypothetical protein
MRRRFARLSSIYAALLCFGFAQVRGADLAFEGVLDLEDRPVTNLTSAATQRSVVLIFMSVDCPISNRYAPTLRKLQTEFQETRFVLVYPNRDETPERVHKALREYELSFEAWRDMEHALVKAAQVKVTPEAAVFLRGTGWVYRGRIDDRYVDWGKSRAEPKVNDLHDVLTAISKGETPPVRSTKAIGCSISKISH